MAEGGVALSERQRSVVERHLAEAGLRDGVRVRQWDGFSSVYSAANGRLWVHRDNPRRQVLQELYFHSLAGTCGTMTCSHPVALWDLRRRLTARETARVQGFPDAMRLPAARMHRLFGNAVCVPCAAHAIAHVLAAHPPAARVVRHFDLCSGIGGFSFALRRVAERSECVGFCEVEPNAIRCYADNFPDAPAFGDAHEVRSWPECDLLTAGFPCQPFSSASTKAQRSQHKSRDFADTVCAAVAGTRATSVVLENVPNFRTVGRAQHERLLRFFRTHGFSVQEAILNAAHYGVPQERKRLFIVACNSRCPPLVPLPPPSRRAVLGDVVAASGGEPPPAAHRVATRSSRPSSSRRKGMRDDAASDEGSDGEAGSGRVHVETSTSSTFHPPHR